MKLENPYTRKSVSNTIMLLIFMVLALLLVYFFPVFFIFLPVGFLLILALIFACLVLFNLYKARKEPGSKEKTFSLFVGVGSLFLLLFIVFYIVINQTIF